MDDSCVEIVSPKKGEPNDDQTNKKNEGDSSGGRPSSPEAPCAICLGTLVNKSFTDSCLHQFCFKCLEQWSRVKAECPLCKQSFKSIIHTVRSIEDYEEHVVENNRESINLSYEPFYPTEVIRRRTTAVTNYLDYFLRLEQAISQHVIPPMIRPRPCQRLLRRHPGTSEFRRNVYQQGLWVQGMRDAPNQYRESTPEFYRTNPAMVHRLVPWLDRELNVLCCSSHSQVHSILHRILELITEVPIRSAVFNEAISPFLGRHTEHFVHEFYSFATCAFDMAGYDRHANYVSRSNLAHEVVSDLSDSTDSDVQIVNEYQAPSDSEECVVVDSIPGRPKTPEVITLESDPEEVVMVNIHIGSDINRPGPSRPTRRPSLKRNWLTVKKAKTSNDNVNVSINIAHNSRSRSRSSSFTSTNSGSSWSPTRKQSTKTKVKKEKRKKSYKGKCLKSIKKSKEKKSKSKVKQSEELDGSPIITKRRRRPSVALPTSSDDSDTAGSSTSSDESEYKPRVRSVVIKSSVKVEPPTYSSHEYAPVKVEPPTYSSHPYSPVKVEPSTYSSHQYSPSSSPNRSDTCWFENTPGSSHDYNLIQNYRYNIDVPECSNSSWTDPSKPTCSRYVRRYSSSSSERPPTKRSKHSDRKSKRK